MSVSPAEGLTTSMMQQRAINLSKQWFNQWLQKEKKSGEDKLLAVILCRIKRKKLKLLLDLPFADGSVFKNDYHIYVLATNCW